MTDNNTLFKEHHIHLTYFQILLLDPKRNCDGMHILIGVYLHHEFQAKHCRIFHSCYCDGKCTVSIDQSPSDDCAMHHYHITIVVRSLSFTPDLWACHQENIISWSLHFSEGWLNLITISTVTVLSAKHWGESWTCWLWVYAPNVTLLLGPNHFNL